MATALLATSIAPAARAAPLAPALASQTPVSRFGTLPTPYNVFLMRNLIIDPDDLGAHDYQAHANESRGLAYTCDAGFLDLDHVRDAADWTAHLYNRLLPALQAGDAELIHPGSEGGVSITVPLPTALTPEERQRHAPAIAMALARRQAFLLLTWHEVITWFGYRTLPLFPEQVSAFTYEDTISHLVGADVAETALAMTDVPYDRAAQLALAQRMSQLRATPRNTTLDALELVKNRWWDASRSWPSNQFVKRRLLDIGQDGKGITPWLVPDLPACQGSIPHPMQIDALGTLLDGRLAQDAGAEITPGLASFWELAFPLGRPQRAGQPIQTINSRTDLGAVMAEIARQVVIELGPGADRP